MRFHPLSSIRWPLAAGLAGAATLTITLAFASEREQVQAPEARGVVLDPLNRPETRQRLPADKQAFLERENELRRRALDHPLSDGIPPEAGTDARITPRAAEPGPVHRAAGSGMIIEAGCGMLYRESSVDFTNKWLAKTGERSVEICAGQTSGQGGVQVTLWNASATAMLPAERQPRQRWFPVPEGHGGALTIVDAVGETLTLQADDGAVFRFDCAALKYVDDPTPKPD